MIATVTILAVLMALLALFFAVEGSRSSRLAEELEGQNADLRGRVSELVAEIRRLRAASGMPSDPMLQAPEDELMPLRQAGRSPGRGRILRSNDSQETVAIVSADAHEQARLEIALSANGYKVAQIHPDEATRYAQELSTAALLFDLREPAIASSITALMAGFARDSLTREVPVFALVANSVERERLIDESSYASAFVVPTDTSVIISALRAAAIRRKTRARRSEAARSLSSAFARS